MDEGCAHGGEAPERHTQGYELGPVVAIRQPPEDGRREHVHDDEHKGQAPQLFVREVQIPAQGLQYRRHHVAVQVVEQVDACQEDQESGAGAHGGLVSSVARGLTGGHLW